ncbi:MalY/PatB family protein [Youngiibacter multivorans]|uniref:cysteine-S-conjugate beta-lyase n=1 Tax=Youngiibacter multivorans TaxID=937251 RepID=A0ABS4G8U0_9CLOT|nr:MalY/PatB family protein [Youngiibacter multivorans]MBP1920976.1 cystathionine beta-lyase [Youngiibacter multivorans]
MRYDFSLMTDRRNTNSMKWDVEDSVLPMWVADMDFRTAPEIIEAIEAKVRKGIFGYTTVPDEWYKSIGDWWERRHNFQIDRDWLIFCTGVVPAISSAVRKLTTVGENILVQTPVYNIFFNSILNNGRNVVESRLIYDDGEYSIDFADLEEKLSDPQTTMMILCNPHNPIGKVWDRVVLERIGELCKKHGVIVISDEIHCDLTENGHSYIPFASVSGECADISITCIAPTKAFNIAGLQTAAVVVPNAMLRHRMNRALNTDEVAEPNAIAMEATIAAFSEGEEWLDELSTYLYENRRVAAEFLESELPELHLVTAHATYLLWVDVRCITMDTEGLCRHLREVAGIYVSAGDAYGESGKGFIRINAACPRERLMDGLERLRKGIEKYKNL